MKTKTLYIALLVVFSIFTLNGFASSPEVKKDKKVKTVITVAKDLKEVELTIEKWMSEIIEFNNITVVLGENEIQIEIWMKTIFPFSLENSKNLEEDVNLEDWMINTYDFMNTQKSFDTELEIEPWMSKIM